MEGESIDSRQERELIRSILSGNKDDFRHLVRAHQDRVFAMIMRQVGSEDLARELSQDVFVRAYRSLGSFRFESSFSTWLTRIAINVANSYFASRRHNEAKRTSSLDMAAYNNTPEQNDGNPYSEEALARLRECITGLKPIYREVIVLCCLENRRYEEAAAVLQIPVGTVCSRMNKAFQILRKNFYCD